MSKLFFSHSCLFLVSLSLFFTACIKNEKGCTDPLAINHNPDAFREDGSCIYTYDSLFIPTHYHFLRGVTSSVDLSLARVHNLLIIDLQQLITNAQDTLTLDTLLNFYTQIPDQNTLTTGNFSPTLSNYIALTRDNLALNNVDIFNNIFEADNTIQAAFETIAANSEQATLVGTSALYIDSTGIDLLEKIEKTLFGAVHYHQAVLLLSNILEVSAEALVDNQNYTAREYAWDLVFGYYGAIINNQATDFEDVNLDGKIDFRTEYRFAFAQLADDLAITTGSTINQSIFQHFLQGRLAISNRLNDLTDSLALTETAALILQDWETLIAEQIIQELEATVVALSSNEPTKNEQISQHWTASVTWLEALRYNPQNRLITVENVLADLGQNPVFEDVNGTYAGVLLTALNTVKAVYGL